MSLREMILKHCELLTERYTERQFLAQLEQRKLVCNESKLRAMLKHGYVAPKTKRLSRVHIFHVALLGDRSRIDWFPWDTLRMEEVERRVELNRLQWQELKFDAACSDAFYAWLDSEQGELPVSAVVRLRNMFKRAGLMHLYGVEMAKLAEADASWRQSPGVILAAAELVRLRAEVERVLEAAGDAGLEVPRESHVKPEGSAPVPEPPNSRLTGALKARPDMEGDTGRLGIFLTQRDTLLRRRDWPELADYLESSEGLFESERARRAWHVALGRVNLEHLDNRAAAIFHFEQALALNHGPDVSAELESLYEEEGRWGALESMLAAGVEATERADERVDLSLRRARILAQELDRGDDALTAVRQVLASGERGHLAQVETMFSALVLDGSVTPSFEVGLIEALSWAYTERGSEVPPGLLEPIGVVEERPALSPLELARLLMVRAQIERSHGQHERAFLTLRRTLALDVLQGSVMDAIESVSRALGNEDELVAVYEEELESEGRGVGTRVALSERIGRLLLDLERFEAGLPHLEAALDAQPENSELLVLLAEGYRRVGRPAASVAMLERLRELRGDEGGEEITEIILQLRRQMAEEDPEGTLALLRADLEGPSRGEALSLLIDFAESAPVEYGAMAVEVLESEGGGLETERYVPLVERLLSDRGLSESRREALRGGISERLEAAGRRLEAIPYRAALFASEPGPRRLAEVQDALLEREGRVAWCEALEREYAWSEDEEARRALLEQLAVVYAQLQDEEGARSAHERIFEQDPGADASFEALCSSYRGAGEWLELTQVLLSRVDIVDEAAGIALLFEVASLLRGEIVDLRGAWQVYNKILGLKPDDERARSEQADLLNVETAWEQRQALFEVAERDAAGERWSALRMRRAVLARVAGESEAAIELTMELVDREPDNVDAMMFLEETLESEGRWAECAAILRRRIKVIAGAEAREAAVLRLAEVLEEHLDAEEEASVLRGQLAMAEPPPIPPPIPEVAAAVPATPPPMPAEASERGRLEAAVRSAEDGAERVLARVALGAWLEARGEAEGAMQMWEAALEEASEREEKTAIAEELAQMAERHGALELAERALKVALGLNSRDVAYVDRLLGFYRRSASWSKFVVMLKFRLARTEDVGKKASLLAELANVAEVEQGDSLGAIEALEALLDVNEAEGLGLDLVRAQRNLASLYARVGEVGVAIDEGEALLESIRGEGHAQFAAVLTDLAALHLSRGDVAEAESLLEEGRRVGGAREGRVRLLELAILVEQERWSEACERAEALLEEGWLEARLEMQAWAWMAKARAGLGDRDEAERAYAEVLKLDPENAEARAYLG